MRRYRFYCPPECFDGSRVVLPPAESHHALRVVRVSPGDQVFVFDGAGREFSCRVTSAGGGRVQLEILEPLVNRVESIFRVTLAQAVVRGERFDLIVQKATELGVARIIPLITDHVEVRLDEARAASRLERWRRVSIEALKQCGRRTLVDISPPTPLNEMIERESAAARVLALSEAGGPIDAALVEGIHAATVVVGPEGGWSASEVDLFEQYKAIPVTLGPRILRTETAAIVAVAVTLHVAGESSSS